MRTKRFLINGTTGVYHVFNRTAYRRRTLDAKEREMFVTMMRKQALFCGLEILSYCVLSNHFHILVRVPKAEKLNDVTLVDRYRCLYRDDPAPRSALRPSDLEKALAVNDAGAVRLREKLHVRMYTLSVFMKELQQRFGIWYNRSHDNTGTLWSDRFHSVIVEHDPAVMRIVAAYIELNSVRAGLSSSPGDYQWCSLAAAIRGCPIARAGIQTVTGRSDYKEAIGIYRDHMFGSGGGTNRPDDHQIEDTQSKSRPLTDELLHQIRALTRGAVLGSAEFLLAFAKKHREHFSPSRRRFVSRVKGLENEEIRSLRKV